MNNKNLWIGMPSFEQKKKKPYKKCTIKFKDSEKEIFIRFENENNFNEFLNKDVILKESLFLFENRKQLAELSSQKITDKTKSIWYPFKSHWGGVKEKYVSNKKIKNKYPIYIVSKGRYSNGLTTKALHTMGVDHYIVIEEQEFDLYNKSKNNSANLIVLPKKYLEEYDTCDEFGFEKSKGPGAARNFCIDHSKDNGFKRHWVMDDNLDAFHYLTQNKKLEVECASTLVASEDFVDRFENVPVAGMNYYSFCKKEDAVPPFITNTRIYSCLLIENDSGYRWRGRYNEDTDLSLRVLKDGKCTIQFNAFLCGKVTTQRMRGGNSKEFYDGEGTLPKSKMLEDLHPDVAKVVWRFNRWHHHVDYKPFKNNKLILKDKNIEYPIVDDYGLKKIQK
jgi:hypothetical protein